MQIQFRFVKIFMILTLLLFSIPNPIGFDIAWAEGLQGPAPEGGVNSGSPDSGLIPPPLPPSSPAPGGFGGQVDSPQPGALPSGSQNQGQPISPSPKMQGGGSPPSLQPGNPMGTQNTPPTSTAPNFMNGISPNQGNPFLPSSTSQGLLSSPLENAYLLSGVPAIAAPLMSAVYRPFGLSYFQPNPFQVTPEGNISLSGYFETDTNINFSTTQPEVGSLYSFGPSAYYSNFDDYGYLSVMGSAYYYSYDTGNITPYLDEMGGINAGTYLGDRVFVGVQDFFFNGSTPQMTGSPLAFFNGINSYYYNMSDAEVGIALTPYITFVQGASDMYFGMGNYGAGFMNLQSLTETLNYMDNSNYVSGSYTYMQGLMSLFPSFNSNAVSGTIMRKVTATTSVGAGGTDAYDWFESPTLNFSMYSYYGLLTHVFTPQLTATFEGGWNTTTFPSMTFSAPLLDLNIAWMGPRVSLGINAGEYMMNDMAYGIETGPENTEDAIGYLSWIIGPKTTFFSSVGYTYYDFLAPSNYSNSFFQTLQPNITYTGSYLMVNDGVNYHPTSWATTTLMYDLIDFSTNIPNETILDNQFIVMITLSWDFH